MTALGDFLEALDRDAEALTPGLPADRAMSDQELRDHADVLRELNERRAERAGVDRSDLAALSVIHTGGAVEQIANRIRSTYHAGVFPRLNDELQILAGSVAFQFFIAGAMWQQQRDLEAMIGGDR